MRLKPEIIFLGVWSNNEAKSQPCRVQRLGSSPVNLVVPDFGENRKRSGKRRNGSTGKEENWRGFLTLVGPKTAADTEIIIQCPLTSKLEFRAFLTVFSFGLEDSRVIAEEEGLKVELN
ncbi:Uncharacterized protein TCM_016483 [Theobroma cacao]|uniref:Uncharacterized protein n=1 Tax=Theobroma cacao TaxID=3641 RepID=A0A061G6K7_THECC|nr:Uncharacterized protein TCM_016483 [Theobroma cacao]